MGSKSFIPFPAAIRFIAKAAGIASLLALLSSCISDGPNQTGGQYLSDHGILLKNPLYHVVLPVFPVDTFWTSDAEPSHLGDTVLMAGTAGNFSGQVRMAFDIADTNFLDSLSSNANSFRLSIGAVPTTGVGLEELKATVGDGVTDTALAFRDSLPFLVETWAVPDRNESGDRLTDAQRRDTLGLYNYRFLNRQDTTTVLPRVTVRDTIKLQIRGAYAANNFQIRTLPHLFDSLKAQATSTKWLLQIQLTPMSDTSDSGSAMLRLGGEGTSTYGPTLLFGSPTNTSSAAAKQKIAPLITAGKRGVNYSLKYAGSRLDLLPAKARGLHLLLDRETLLDSLDAALQRQGITPPSRAIHGNFDLTYFVPFGQISLPLADSMNLEGNFPMELRLASDLDSLLPHTPRGSISTSTVPLNDPTTLISTIESGTTAKLVDTLSVIYKAVASADTALRKVILSFSPDSSKNDTVFMKVGETRDVAITKGYGNSPLILTLLAAKASVQISYYLSSHAVTEPNDLRDETTGNLLTTLSEKLPRLLQPGQNRLALRATRGIQRLLNRADAGDDIFPDLLIQPISQAVDDSVTSGGFTGTQRVPYPVLSLISPKFETGRLSIRLDLYLYPLKQER